MSLTDPVSDFLTRVRNAINARHQKVDVPHSKLKVEMARILKEEGYIANFKAIEEEGRKVLRVYLKYSPDNSSPISDLKRISRPGCRVYVGHTDIPRVLGGLGINILTTPKGVMTGRQARKEVSAAKCYVRFTSAMSAARRTKSRSLDSPSPRLGGRSG